MARDMTGFHADVRSLIYSHHQSSLFPGAARRRLANSISASVHCHLRPDRAGSVRARIEPGTGFRRATRPRDSRHRHSARNINALATRRHHLSRRQCRQSRDISMCRQWLTPQGEPLLLSCRRRICRSFNNGKSLTDAPASLRRSCCLLGTAERPSGRAAHRC